MKKYLDLEGFTSFIEDLPIDKYRKVGIKNMDNGKEFYFLFKKIFFAGESIILYENPYGSIGIIQDTPVSPMEGYIPDVFECFEGLENDYKVFINENRVSE